MELGWGTHRAPTPGQNRGCKQWRSAASHMSSLGLGGWPDAPVAASVSSKGLQLSPPPSPEWQLCQLAGLPPPRASQGSAPSTPARACCTRTGHSRPTDPDRTHPSVIPEGSAPPAPYPCPDLGRSHWQRYLTQLEIKQSLPLPYTVTGTSAFACEPYRAKQLHLFAQLPELCPAWGKSPAPRPQLPTGPGRRNQK